VDVATQPARVIVDTPASDFTATRDGRLVYFASGSVHQDGDDWSYIDPEIGVLETASGRITRHVAVELQQAPKALRARFAEAGETQPRTISFGAVDLVPGERLLAADVRFGGSSWGRYLGLWTLPSLRWAHSFDASASEPSVLSYAPDARQALLTSADTVRRVSFATDRVIESNLSTGSCSRPISAQFSPDGRLIAVAAEDFVCLLDARSGRELNRTADIPTRTPAEDRRTFTTDLDIQFVANGSAIFVASSDSGQPPVLIRTSSGEIVWHGKEPIHWTRERRAIESNGVTALVFDDTAYVIDPLLSVKTERIDALRSALGASHPEAFWSHDSVEALRHTACRVGEYIAPLQACGTLRSSAH
jgi:WD40 repeat protein